MSVKFTDELVNDCARRIMEGETLKSVCADIGCKGETLRKHFISRGIILAQYLHNVRQNSLPQEEIISRYIGGESEIALSKVFNCSRGTITKILRNHNIPRRSGSQANVVRMSKLSVEERKEIVRKANDAMRGTNPIKRLSKKAISVENNQAIIRIGPGEVELGEFLEAVGHKIIRQKAIGIYNIDIIFGTVAVEVKFGAHSRFQGTKTPQRVKCIFEAGYKLVLIIFNDTTAICEGIEEIVALLNVINGKPTTGSQYWVIRSGLHDSPIRKTKIDNSSKVPPPPELVTSIRKVDIS